MKQIPLPLVDLNEREQDELLITDCNEAVFDHISNMKGSQQRLLLIGPLHSGKNLMGRYFEQCNDGLFIKNADTLSDEKLFFLWNQAHGNDVPLLMTTLYEPALWDIKLPDLQSRIASMDMIMMPMPDDALVSQLIQQKLRRFNASISMQALSYAVKRIERDYEYLHEFMDACIIMSKEQNVIVQLQHVKDILNRN